MKVKVLAMLSVLSFVVCSLAYAEVPEYTAMKTGSRMAMDGILDEPAWQKAKPLSAFKFQWYKSGEKEQTEAKILWDNERIYFAFTCDDKHIGAEQYTHGGPVSRDDCCEAFISPVPEGNERLDYLNYEINCIGTRLLGYHARSRDKNFYWGDVTGIEIGRVINGTCNNDDDTDTGWVLEFSVPFAHFRAFDTTAEKKDDPPDTVTNIKG
ncbi:carbohydrate-binding family 9-like protein, partial [Candidatus Latescibacterota bacterium]